jgi:hypothetical protein
VNVQHLIRRLSAASPEVIIVDSLRYGRIVHAVYDHDGEPRREVFVMSTLTWSRIELDASLITPYPARWPVRRAKDVGLLSHNDTLLTLPLPMMAVVDHESDAIPSIVPRREWRIQL